jgi:MFS family permease
MYTVMLWGWLGRKIGLRRLLTIGFATAGVLTLTVGVVAGWPLQAAGILIIGAIGISIADGAGNVPFLRAVRAHDRSEMTTVFSTYRDSARLAMPALYSLLLLVFPLSAVFFASGGIMCGLAVLAGYLPRNLGRERRRR